jgi:membrane-associated phospholipid phosphatase
MEARALQHRNYGFVVVSLLTAVLAFVLAKLGSHVISDPRPFFHDGTAALVASAKDNGFPSDHTLLASVAACIGWHYRKRYGIGLGVVAILVAWGRVAAHVHHLTDVVGAMVFAVLGYLLALVAWRLYRSRQHPKTVSD